MLAQTDSRFFGDLCRGRSADLTLEQLSLVVVIHMYLLTYNDADVLASSIGCAVPSGFVVPVSFDPSLRARLSEQARRVFTIVEDAGYSLIEFTTNRYTSPCIMSAINPFELYAWCVPAIEGGSDG